MKQFLKLYKRFVNGSRWLGKRKLDGFHTEKDKKDFIEDIRNPLIESFPNLSKDEKDFVGRVSSVIKIFKGEII